MRLKRIRFEMYHNGSWKYYAMHCVAFELDQNDANMLIVWRSDGIHVYSNPVRNFYCETVK